MDNPHSASEAMATWRFTNFVLYCIKYTSFVWSHAFSALMLLVWQQEGFLVWFGLSRV